MDRLLLAGHDRSRRRSRIQDLRERHRGFFTDKLGRVSGNGHKVLDSLFDRPIIAVNDVMKVTGTTYATANTLVARLTYLGSSSPACGGIRVVTHQAAAFLSNSMRRNRAHWCKKSSGRMPGRIFLQFG